VVKSDVANEKAQSGVLERICVRIKGGRTPGGIMSGLQGEVFYKKRQRTVTQGGITTGNRPKQ